MRAAVRRCIATLGLLAASSGVASAGTTFTSGVAQAHLVELYTSEGCSSCPPAERWLGSLKSHPELWSRLVPVAFHVDYWDYLGWRDDYARAEFSRRQQRYAQLRQVSSVYTPGMFLDGQEWRDWRASSALAGRTLAAGADIGKLTLVYERQASTVSFVPAANRNAAGKVHLALLGVDLTSPIKDGENKGKLLRHDFVVLELVSSELKRTANGFTAALPALSTKLTAPRYAVAAWVTDSEDSRPLQVTGGWLSDGN